MPTASRDAVSGALLAVHSVVDAPGDQVLLDHQRHLEGDGVVKLPQIQSGKLLDLLQAVHQGVPVDKELPGRLGYVQVVLKELVDGEQGLLVQASMGFFLNTSWRNISHRVVGNW